MGGKALCMRHRQPALGKQQGCPVLRGRGSAGGCFPGSGAGAQGLPPPPEALSTAQRCQDARQRPRRCSVPRSRWGAVLGSWHPQGLSDLTSPPLCLCHLALLSAGHSPCTAECRVCRRALSVPHRPHLPALPRDSFMARQRLQGSGVLQY